MTDLHLVATILGATALGVVITLAVQLVGAIRAQSREVARASRRVGDLAELLKPLAKRMERLSALVEEGEPDMRRLQQSLHQISKGSEEFAENFARAGGWVGMAAPFVMAAVEGWTGRTAAEVPPAPGPSNGAGVADP